MDFRFRLASLLIWHWLCRRIAMVHLYNRHKTVIKIKSHKTSRLINIKKCIMW